MAIFRMNTEIYYRMNNDCMHDYTSLEYYPIGKLRGYQRILIELREYLKGKTDIVHFVRTYHDLLNEEKAK